MKENILEKLLLKHGTDLCSYVPKRHEYLLETNHDFKGKKAEERLEEIRTKDFLEVGYYFIVDSSTGEPLIITSIGDQWGRLGFNDRISRIQRKATKQNTQIYNNHYMVDIVFVPPSKIKHFTDNESVWNFLKGTKKTERNTILENARLIKKVYTFKY